MVAPKRRDPMVTWLYLILTEHWLIEASLSSCHKKLAMALYEQRWSRGHKALGQGQGHKKISRPRTDPLEAKDTGASVLQKKGFQKIFSSNLKKKVFKIFFQAKKVFKKFFSGDFSLRKTKKGFTNFLRGFWRFPTKFQRFKKYCWSRAEDRAIFEDLRLRGQGLQNLSSRPRTSSRTPPLYTSTSLQRFHKNAFA